MNKVVGVRVLLGGEVVEIGQVLILGDRKERTGEAGDPTEKLTAGRDRNTARPGSTLRASSQEPLKFLWLPVTLGPQLRWSLAQCVLAHHPITFIHSCFTLPEHHSFIS